VHFTYTPHQFEISIIDNGIGFNYQPELNFADGMGLMNIISRVKVVGGEVSLKSIEGNGCSVFIRVPYNQVESHTQ
jgi:signal transduction histidine kinase